jgi:hypothetical protein
MAAAVGQREVSMDADIAERWPYFRYVPSVSKAKRDGHRAFYNLILRKDDPFWRTHTPPWDFGCKCSLEDAGQEDADAAGGEAKAIQRQGGDGNTWAVALPNGQALSVSTPPSGFVFDVESALKPCDMSLIKNIPTRRAVLQDLRDYAKATKTPFTIISKSATEGPAVSKGASPQDISAFLLKAAGNQSAGRKIGKELLTIGELSSEMKDSLGITGASRIDLSLAHTVKHHSQELITGDAQKILSEVLGSPGAMASITLKRGENALTLTVKSKDQPGKDAIVVMELDDEKSWQVWKVLSIHYGDPRYMDNQRVLTKRKG